MAVYKLFHLTIESPESLNLPQIECGLPDLNFRIVDAKSGFPKNLRAVHIHTIDLADESPWLALYRTCTGYYLHFFDLAGFLITDGWQEIICFPHAAISMNTIEHLFLDQVIPLMLSHQGKLILHASAVEIDGKAVAFVGESGRGKSTLSASLCQQGYPFLTDDCLYLEKRGHQYSALPSYQSVRLWSDVMPFFSEQRNNTSKVAHYSSKERLEVGNPTLPYCEEAMPLDQIFLLAPRDESIITTRITSMSPKEKYIQLVQSVFRLNPTDKTVMHRDLETIVNLIDAVPVYWLNYPRSLERLPEVHRTILTHCRANAHV